MANKKNQPVADNSVAGNLEEKIAALQMEKDALEETVKEFEEQLKKVEKYGAALQMEKDALEETVKEFEEQLKKVEEDGAASGKQETEQEYLERRKTIKLNGRTYAFKFGTPNKISVDGKAMEIDEIIKDEGLMEELIVGNLSFVEQVN